MAVAELDTWDVFGEGVALPFTGDTPWGCTGSPRTSGFLSSPEKGGACLCAKKKQKWTHKSPDPQEKSVAQDRVPSRTSKKKSFTEKRYPLYIPLEQPALGTGNPAIFMVSHTYYHLLFAPGHLSCLGMGVHGDPFTAIRA